MTGMMIANMVFIWYIGGQGIIINQPGQIVGQIDTNSRKN